MVFETHKNVCIRKNCTKKIIKCIKNSILLHSSTLSILYTIKRNNETPQSYELALH